MPRFILHHTHGPGECDEVLSTLEGPEGAALRGSSFFCCCASGDHSGFFEVEAAEARAALALLPERLRGTTRAYAGEPIVI